jgi:AcrR family transcriptional regulator
VAQPDQAASARRTELLESAYRYSLEHGLVSMSLRPLADAVGSSPRVLLFLFGSKDGLVRALLARARQNEEVVLADVRDAGGTLVDVGLRLWTWLSAPDHRSLLTLWAEAYTRSLIDPAGPWAGFADETVQDWLTLLAGFQPQKRRRSAAAAAERTAVLALLRGAFLDLLATGDADRTTRAVTQQLTSLELIA